VPCRPSPPTPRHRRAAGLLAAALAAAALGGCGAAGDGGSGGTATAAGGVPEGALWVAPTGDDGAGCTKGHPCATLSAALDHALAGATILVASGRYPEQEVRGGPGADAGASARDKPVVIRPAPGARPRLGKLLLHTPGLELRDLALAGWQAFDDSGRLTLRRVSTPWFYIDGASNVKLLGGSVGPADSVDPQIRAVDTDGAPVPTNILIDGVTFHDFTNEQDPSAHIECLQFGAVEHGIVRNSTFVRCAEHSVFAGAWGGTAKIHDLSFVGNRLGSVPKGFYSIRVGRDSVSDITLRRNSAVKVMQVDPGVPGVTIERNVAPREPWECFAGQRYIANVWSHVRCSKTDRKVGARAVSIRARDRARRPGA
jgi:hypothetical protein